MRFKPFTLVLFYCFLFLADSVYGRGENIRTLGSVASWELMERRQGIIEASNIRPYPVLVLSNQVIRPVENESYVDLRLSFDEREASLFADSRRRHDVIVSSGVSASRAPLSRVGAGAALFNSSFGARTHEPIVIQPRPNALFASNSHIRDFSIEFWLYPLSTDEGMQILSWEAARPNGRGGFSYQQIRCVVLRNRIQWDFTDFFLSPGGGTSKRIILSGPPIIPRTWSHHLIRFDADLGILEYLVDGRLEALEYVTSTGRERGEVFTPFVGLNSRFVLGNRFSGMIDEFRIYRNFVDTTALTKFPAEGGRIESRTIDLGFTNSRVVRIEASGGRTSPSVARVRNEYAGNSALRFQDHAEISFYIRTSNRPYQWDESPWIPVNAGMPLPNNIRGRYVQLAADFYPSADGDTSPYLSELRIVYDAARPPLPPTQLMAVAKDGAVELSWRASSSRNVGGYLVFFGTARGEYFGANSPIDAGNSTSIRIEGLNNGTLYFFAVAAYNRPEPLNGVNDFLEPGEFSREVAARPLRMAE